MRRSGRQAADLAEGRLEPLVPRPGAWGVDPELETLHARDLLGRSLRAAGERLTAPFAPAAVSLPGSAAAIRPARRREILESSPAAGIRRPASVPDAPSGAPTPLRL